MILSTKNINVTNTDLGLNINLTTKSKLNFKTLSKSLHTVINHVKDLDLSLHNEFIYVLNTVKGINVKTVKEKIKKAFVDEVIVDDNVVEFFNWQYEIPLGWSFFSCPIDVSKALMTHNYMDGYVIGDSFDYTTNTDLTYKPANASTNPYINYELNYMALFFKNNVYESLDDEIPLFFKDSEKYKQSIGIIKNSGANAYIPEYDFDGIKSVNPFYGYQINLKTKIFFKIKAQKYNEISTINDIDANYVNGWQYISFNSLSNINIKDYLQPFIDENKVYLVKDYKGTQILPQYNFYGIEDMQPGEAYLAKFINL